MLIALFARLALATSGTVPPTDPVVVEPGPIYEGADAIFSASSTDPDGGAVSYAWSFGDGGTADGEEVVHAWTDNGDFDVTVVATDDEGDSASTILVQPVLNAPPSIDDVTWIDGFEGERIEFQATVSDPGIDDILVVEWEWADGSPADSGAAVSHAFMAPGLYEVTVSVSDDDGDVTITDIAVTVANLDPEITSAPGTRADQDIAYSYAPTADDAGSMDGLTWTLDAGPAGASIDADTGVVTWTPTYEQCATDGSFTITVSDGEGGSASQSWSVDAVATDSDGDGMPDDYEAAVGHDPDVDDGGEDPDADGYTHLEEYLAGTDPFAYEGPGQPENVSPTDGADATASPTLVVSNTTNGRGLDQVYTFSVYADEALSILVAGSDDWVEEGAGETGWSVDVTLDEDTMYWWTAAASDGFVLGEASAATSFFVNEVESAPGAPTPISPLRGDLVASLAPTLTFTRATDPEGSAVTYDVQVLDADGAAVVAEVGDLADAETGVYPLWSVDPELVEDTIYQWRVRATDDGGNAGAWSETQEFLVSTEDGAPGIPAWVSPLDGDSLVELQPSLSWTETSDPEGMAVTYAVQGDVVPTFDSAALRSTTIGGDGTGTVTIDLEGSAVFLPENTDLYLRVRAADPGGIASDWATIRVFSRGENDAPPVPVLVTPTEGVVLGVATPELVAELGADPEGDGVSWEFAVSRTADPEDPLVSGTGPVEGVEARWNVDPPLAPGAYYWSARALDDMGGASDWANPRAFTVDFGGEDTGDTGDTGVVEDTSGPGDTSGTEDSAGGGAGFEVPPEEECGCAATKGAGAWGIALVAAAAAGRRRRSVARGRGPGPGCARGCATVSAGDARVSRTCGRLAVAGAASTSQCRRTFGVRLLPMKLGFAARGPRRAIGAPPATVSRVDLRVPRAYGRLALSGVAKPAADRAARAAAFELSCTDGFVTWQGGATAPMHASK